MHLDLSEMLSTTEVQRENNITRQANKQAIKRINQNSSFY